MTDKATATILGGFWPANGVSSLDSIANAYGANRKKIAQLFKMKGLRSLRARVRALDGVVAGSNATAQVGEVDGSTSELGGSRTINTTNLINRNTTAADITEINATVAALMTSSTTFGASPPANLDGNPLGTR